MATKRPIAITEEMRNLVLKGIQAKEPEAAIRRKLGLSTYIGKRVIREIAFTERRRELAEREARTAEVMRNLYGLSQSAINVLCARGLTSRPLVKKAMKAGELDTVFSDGRTEIATWLKAPPNA